jgi:hypothetical protein
MSNEMEFSAQAHNLLMKTEAAISEHQERKNRSASIQASPQVARKKRFTKLNLNFLDSPRVNNDSPVNSDQEKEDGSQESLAKDATKENGIDPPQGRPKSTHICLKDPSLWPPSMSGD